jgi:hypothetical protein
VRVRHGVTDFEEQPYSLIRAANILFKHCAQVVGSERHNEDRLLAFECESQHGHDMFMV